MDFVQTIENKYGQVIGQFLRFVVVGFINTAINFIVLNFLSYLTGIKSGSNIIFLAAISFSVATSNSYFMNKRWAFKDNSNYHTGRKFTRFLLVSLVGLAINSGIVYFITTFFHPIFNLSATPWLNVGIVIATGVSLIWNFIGYKLFVFNKD